MILKTESAIGTKARVEHDWQLVDLKAPVGTEIRYWVEAYDARVPNRVVKRELALVVTDDEKRQDVQNRAADSITALTNGCSAGEAQ